MRDPFVPLLSINISCGVCVRDLLRRELVFVYGFVVVSLVSGSGLFNFGPMDELIVSC